MVFESLALKPGRPTWAARLPRSLLIGLPGNPWAALVAARLLVTPVLAQIESGAAETARRWAVAPTQTPIPSGANLEGVLGARLEPAGIRILERQDSAAHSHLADLTCLVRRPVACLPSHTGDLVHYLAF
jgi:molybdopterin molybdotransferase